MSPPRGRNHFDARGATRSQYGTADQAVTTDDAYSGAQGLTRYAAGVFVHENVRRRTPDLSARNSSTALVSPGQSLIEYSSNRSKPPLVTTLQVCISR